jgi:hypothetical protein
VTVFEAEESLNFRAQGGTLDLRHDGGLAAIKAAGLQDVFERDARYDGESLMIADKHLKAWLRMTETGAKNSASRPDRPPAPPAAPIRLLAGGNRAVESKSGECGTG